MTVHFIGAGPGAADLITLRGRDLIAACPVCLYAGSLVPEALLAHCPPGARIVNTAPLSLDELTTALQLPKPTVYRILTMLKDADLLRREPGSKRYTVGPRLSSFALDLWRGEITDWLPEGVLPAKVEKELYFGGLYQKVVMTR